MLARVNNKRLREEDEMNLDFHPNFQAVKTPKEIVTGITLDSTNLTIDPYDAVASATSDYRATNTSSDLTIQFNNPLILDSDNQQYEIALDSPTSVPIADHNVVAARDNSDFKYIWSGGSAGVTDVTTITVPDGYRSITEIQDYIRTQLLAAGHTDGLTPVGYPIEFTNDFTVGKVSMVTNGYMQIVLTPGSGGYASGIMGLFGFTGEASEEVARLNGGAIGTPDGTDEDDYYTYLPAKVANINDQVSSYYINCDVTKATIDANGSSNAIKQYMVHEVFGSRQDFTNTGPLRWCAVDKYIKRIDSIRVWVTDNRHRPVDWHGESSTFILLFRQRKMSV